MKLPHFPIGLLINFVKGCQKRDLSDDLPGANQTVGSEDDDISLYKNEERKGNEELNFSPVTILVHLVHFVAFCKNLLLRRAGASPEQKETKNKVFSNSSNSVSFISF
jgi:hypothetical protein